MIWNQQYAVGIDTIDRQHRELFRRLQRVEEQLALDSSREAIDDVLQFLLVYVHLHFNDEEQYMELHGYPGLQQHRRSHRDFLQQVQSLMKQRDAMRRREEEIRDLIVEWIIDHVLFADQAFGHYMDAKA